MRLCDAETMRGLDHRSIHDVGIPGVVLMENAGRGTSEAILQRWGDALVDGVSILCGRGNNGGDGYVIGRHLHNAGLEVEIYVFSPRERIVGDAKINLKAAGAMGIPLQEVATLDLWLELRESACSRSLIVDALLGTGLNSDVRGLLRQVIEDVNSSGCPVVAVDIPSGLEASTGRPLGVAVRADLTATYGLAKLGQVLEPALECVGDLLVVDISIPLEFLEQTDEDDRFVEGDEVARLLPQRPFDGHKGTFGHLAVVAGSVGKVGAAMLACHAALRSGVGLVTLAIPRSAAGYLNGLWPEVMLDLLEDEDKGHLVPASVDHLLELCTGRTAIALGPGISTEPGVREVVVEIMTRAGLPLVIDADALNVLASETSVCRGVRGSLVLTPHPGEAARLLGTTTRAIQEDRVGSARCLAEALLATVVLKGARTLTCSPKLRVSVNSTGNVGMATGGSGDVLTGVIGGLLAQGLVAESAAACGAYLHGLAGDLACERHGMHGLVAGDLIEALGQAIVSTLEAWS